jgi:hypothetical protein
VTAADLSCFLEPTVNKAQRKTLQEAVDRIVPFCEEDTLDGTDETKTKIEAALANLESVTTDLAVEERDKFDNMPEGLQASENGQKIEEAADTLENLTFPDMSDYDLKTDEGRDSLQSDLTSLVDELEALL